MSVGRIPAGVTVTPAVFSGILCTDLAGSMASASDALPSMWPAYAGHIDGSASEADAIEPARSVQRMPEKTAGVTVTPAGIRPTDMDAAPMPQPVRAGPAPVP